MRPLILAMHYSLDGHVAGPKGELDWITFDDLMDAEIRQELAEADACLLGRKLYEGFAGYWPQAEQIKPNLSAGEKLFQRWIQDNPKYVLTKTLDAGTWEGTHLLKGDLVQEVTALKNQPGKAILTYGGASTAAALVAAGLVDELRLRLEPNAIGEGQALFKDMKDRQAFELIRATEGGGGAVSLMYRKK